MEELVKLNRYVGNYGTTKVPVDAPDMATAVKFMIDQKGGVEPNTVILQDIGISYAKPQADVTFQAIVECIDHEVPGDVFPREGACAVGNKIIFTAKPRDGFRFTAFTTPSGTVLGTDTVLSMNIVDTTQILVKFAKIPTQLGSTTVVNA